jgi:hypothetical protein
VPAYHFFGSSSSYSLSVICMRMYGVQSALGFPFVKYGSVGVESACRRPGGGGRRAVSTQNSALASLQGERGGESSCLEGATFDKEWTIGEERRSLAGALVSLNRAESDSRGEEWEGDNNGAIMVGEVAKIESFVRLTIGFIDSIKVSGLIVVAAEGAGNKTGAD